MCRRLVKLRLALFVFVARAVRCEQLILFCHVLPSVRINTIIIIIIYNYLFYLTVGVYEGIRSVHKNETVKRDRAKYFGAFGAFVTGATCFLINSTLLLLHVNRIGRTYDHMKDGHH